MADMRTGFFTMERGLAAMTDGCYSAPYSFA